MYQQDVSPLGGPLVASAVCAVVPLAVLLFLLGGLRWRAHWAGLTALATGVVVAVAVYGMPVGQTLDAGVLGAAEGTLLIIWITLNALWIYNMTVRTGHFAVMRRAFSAISDDMRIQAIVIAFCFGALLEALAGGGAPVAICAVMLIAVGFDPIKAAAVALVADTAPVAFGGLGNPITVLADITGLPADDLGAMAGRQVPFLALIVPLVLVFIVDGRRGVRETWPAAAVAGVVFALVQFAVSNYGPYKLTDIAAAVVAVGALILMLRGWSPAATRSVEPRGGGGRPAMAGAATHDPAHERSVGGPDADSRRDVVVACAPYAIIVVVFSLAQITVIKDLLAHGTVTFDWPGLDIRSGSGDAVDTSYELTFLSATGSLLLLSGVLSMLALRVTPRDAVAAYGETLRQFGWAIVTILCVFALAFVMNLSGQTLTLGTWLAGAGGFFAFLAPVVGWVGVTISGTDAGANALFGTLHVTAAKEIGASPVLLAAANSSGGVMAKMISPQSLAIAAAAVSVVGAEGRMFRRVFGWSVGLLLVVCVLVYLQSTSVLGWMVT